MLDFKKCNNQNKAFTERTQIEALFIISRVKTF